ncbi:MAG: restriction endonuclease subunit S [Lewinellaceae bacterium]|nr:restriction endonuclease subunit S [Lewinellaceae bacterium]
MIEVRKNRSVEKETRPGYKPTKLGWLPVEWEVKRLDKLAHIQKGIAKGRKISGESAVLPYMRVANVQDGYLDLSTVKKIKVPKEEISKYLLKYGDVLLTEGGDFDKLGRGTVWKNEVENCVHQNHIFAVRTNPEKLLPKFLSELSSSFYGRKYFMLSSKQSTNLASINSTQLKAFPVPLPPLPEQQQIAAILSAWDKAIERTQALIAAKEERRKGVMRRLLRGKVRVKGFGGAWREVHLRDIFEERKETGFNELPLLAITADRGVIYRDELDKKDTSNDDKSKYKRICPGDIGYNTMRMWQGRSAVSNLEGIVSPAYTIVTPNEGIDVDFMGNLFQLPETIHLFWRFSQGLVSDTLNCKFPSFAQIKVMIPPTYEEQAAISKILELAGEEIRLLTKRLEALRAQKKGLMQRLLTGKVRVKI